jgi:hypothetical protein
MARISNVKPLIVSVVVCDVVLLLVMLAGLLRLRHRDGAFLDLVYTLWKQVRHYVRVGCDAVSSLRLTS